VSLGSLAVPAGVPPGLGGGGHTCSVLIIITEDVVKGSELVDQGQAIVAEALVGWLGGCGWGCCCCALGLHCLLLLRLWGLLGLLGGLLPGLRPSLARGLGWWCPAADQHLVLAV
jgi:hypothetical protein